MALIDVRNSAHDFSVKLSSCICNHTDSSCPGCWLIDIYMYLWVTIPVMSNDILEVSVLIAQACPQ